MSPRRSHGRLGEAVEAFASNWRNADLRRAQLSFFAAWASEWAFTVALGIVAYDSGGVVAVGLVGLLRMLPSAVLTPLLAPFADRGRRERTLIVVSLIRAVTTGAAAAIVALSGPVEVIYAIAAVTTVASTLFRPAHSALLPTLCRSGHELASANVVRGMLDSIATLIGPLGAAVLLATTDVAVVFVVAAGASLWAAGLLLRVRYEAPPRDGAARRPRLIAEAVDGFRALARSKELTIITLLIVAQTFTRGALSVFSVVVAIEMLGMGDSGVGVLMAAVGGGAVLGSVASSLLVSSRRLGAWFAVGVALWGLPFVLIGLFPQWAAVLVLLAVVGTANALIDVAGFTLIGRLAPDAVMARVFGVQESLIAVAIGLGSLAASGLIEWIGLPGALIAIGSLCPVLAGAFWWRLRRLDGTVGALDDQVRMLQRVPMFDPLPLPSIEHLARGLEPVEVPAGVTVFAQGDIGDRYYLIESGEADVLGDGRFIATLGVGEGFGEIALLRRVPRTATVIARTALLLQALTAERFTVSVLGFTPSAAAAASDIDTELDRFSPSATPVGDPAADPSVERGSGPTSPPPTDPGAD